MKVKGRKNADGTYTIIHEGIEFPAKRCSRCKQVRFLKHFHKDRTRKDGHMSHCRKCAEDVKSLYRMYNFEPKYKELGE